MQAACVLNESSLPGHRHSKEKRVETRVVEALSDVTTSRQNKSLGGVRNRSQLLKGLTPLLARGAALQHDQVTNETTQLVG